MCKPLRILDFIIVSLSVLVSAGAQAQHINSSTYGYSLSMPGDWARIPPEEFNAVVREFFPQQVRDLIHYEFGFLHSTSDGLLLPPYCLVGVQEYKSGGIQGQPSVARLKRIVSDSFGVRGFKKTLDAAGDILTADMLPNEEDVIAVFDEESLTCQVVLTMQNPNIGPLTVHSVMFFGKNCFVTANLYYEEGKSGTAIRDVQQVRESYQFTDAARYDPTIPSTSPILSLIDKAVPAIVFGVFSAIAGMVYQSWRKKGDRASIENTSEPSS